MLSQQEKNASNSQYYFQHIIIHVNLSESTMTGSLVCQLYVNETHSGAKQKLHYSMTSVEQSQTRSLFTLNEYTGELRVSGLLDFETVKKHYLLIAVRYSSLRSYTSYATIYINILDVNEYAPQFFGLYIPSKLESHHINVLDNDLEFQNLGTFTFYISGLNPVNSSVGCVTAYDPDSDENGKIVYSIVKGDTSDFFAIEPLNGCIILAKSLLPNYAYSTTG
uniref:Cadherin domain-containing protein n=1 Tax=Trichobilharzia regenti TaxID=157069 RepID=A0AA85JV73_TRIRE|nr:unnamed protein product [Trichobilharzia regenti]